MNTTTLFLFVISSMTFGSVANLLHCNTMSFCCRINCVEIFLIRAFISQNLVSRMRFVVQMLWISSKRASNRFDHSHHSFLNRRKFSDFSKARTAVLVERKLAPVAISNRVCTALVVVNATKSTWRAFFRVFPSWKFSSSSEENRQSAGGEQF